jgi:dephospho-CoA kinase
MKKIAITGGIGSGKSTVSRYLAQKGYPVFSCDEISKKIWETEEYQNVIASAFPLAVLDGDLDRKALSKIVFDNKDELARLNKIAHPYILKKLQEEMDLASADLVFAEVPLLFEGNYVHLFDGAIVVLREKEQRITSVKQRDGLTVEEVVARINNQFNYDKNLAKLKETYYCIENNAGENELQMQIDQLLKSLT